MTALDPRLARAIGANLAWYELMCAVHGVRTRLAEGIWSAIDRPPPLHSDAQVVAPGVPLGAVMDRLGDRQPAGFKDCLANVDAGPAGMSRLFDASWIHRAPGTSRRPAEWHEVRDERELARWNAAWDTADVLLPAVLGLPELTVLADGEEARRGAVLTVVDGVAYLSNAHGDDGSVADWEALVAVAAELAPGCPVVGYERGPDLAGAVHAGFEVVGDLTVWVR